VLLPNVTGGKFGARNHRQRHHPSVYFNACGVGFVNQILQGIETGGTLGSRVRGSIALGVKSIATAADLGDDRVGIGPLRVCDQFCDFLRSFEAGVEGVHPEGAKFGGLGLRGHSCASAGWEVGEPTRSQQKTNC
jgi:hypothetical protein